MQHNNEFALERQSVLIGFHLNIHAYKRYGSFTGFTKDRTTSYNTTKTDAVKDSFV